VKTYDDELDNLNYKYFQFKNLNVIFEWLEWGDSVFKIRICSSFGYSDACKVRFLGYTLVTLKTIVDNSYSRT